MFKEKYFKTFLYVTLSISLCLNCYFIIRHLLSPIHIFKPLRTKISFRSNEESIFKLIPIHHRDIVFAGDSHIQLFLINEILPGYSLKNRGISGETSAGLLKRIPELTTGMPEKIFIEIGFNDLIQNIPADSTLKNIISIIKEIRAHSPETKIFFNSIFPCNVMPNGVRVELIIPILNNNLKKLCMQFHVTFIDMYSLLQYRKGLSPIYDGGDGIHLNGNGYSLWSKILKWYL